MSLLVLSLILSTATPSEGPGVAILPLRADGEMDAKELRGVTALFRTAVENGAYARLLNVRKDDDKTVRLCGTDAPCLKDAAFARGVDLIASGRARATDSGYDITLTIVSHDDEPMREVALSIAADDMDAGFDRLGRLAFRPTALRGAMLVRGAPEGALVLVDDQRIGKLPLDGPIEDLQEGDHTLEVRADGFETMTRPVAITHRETASVDVVLSKERLDLESPLAASQNESGPLDVVILGLPWVTLVGAVGTLAVGVACGVVSMFDRAEVERRAEAKLLVFPRDTALVRRGSTTALAANIFYVSSAALFASTGGAFALTFLVGGGEE